MVFIWLQTLVYLLASGPFFFWLLCGFYSLLSFLDGGTLRASSDLISLTPLHTIHVQMTLHLNLQPRLSPQRQIAYPTSLLESLR